MRSYDSPNIGVSLWFAQFSAEYNESTTDYVSRTSFTVFSVGLF